MCGIINSAKVGVQKFPIDTNEICDDTMELTHSSNIGI